MFNKVDTDAMKLLLVIFVLNVSILKHFAKGLSSEKLKEECKEQYKCFSSAERQKELNVIILNSPIIYIKSLKKNDEWEEKNIDDYEEDVEVRNHNFADIQKTEPRSLLNLLKQTDYNRNIDDPNNYEENKSFVKNSVIDGYQNTKNENKRIDEEDDNYVESTNKFIKQKHHKDDIIKSDEMSSIYDENLKNLWFTLSKYLGIRFGGSLPKKRILHNIVLLINAYFKFIDLEKAKKVSEKETQERRVNKNSKDFINEVKKQTDHDNMANMAIKLKKLITDEKNTPMHFGKIIVVILTNIKPFILNSDNEPCLNETMEYLITSTRKAYQEYLNNKCNEDYIDIDRILKAKIVNLANVVKKLEKSDLKELLLSIFSIKTDEGTTIKQFSDLISTTLSEQYLRKLLYHTMRLRLLSEYCENIAFNSFFSSIKATIVNVKQRYCSKFYTKANSDEITMQDEPLFGNKSDLLAVENESPKLSNKLIDAVNTEKLGRVPQNPLKILLGIKDFVNLDKKDMDNNNNVKLSNPPIKLQNDHNVNLKKDNVNRLPESIFKTFSFESEDIQQLPLKEKLTDERNFLNIVNIDVHGKNNELIFHKDTPQKDESDPSSYFSANKTSTMKTKTILKLNTLGQKVTENETNKSFSYGEMQKDKILKLINIIQQQKLNNSHLFEGQTIKIGDNMNDSQKFDTSKNIDVDANQKTVNFDVIQDSSSAVNQVVNLKDKVGPNSFTKSNDSKENGEKHKVILAQLNEEKDEESLYNDSKKYTLSPAGTTIVTNNLLKPDRIKNLALNQLKISPPKIYIQFSSTVPGNISSEYVELTYDLYSPKLLIYQPHLLIKHRIPYNYYLHNLNTIIQEETNPKDDEFKLLNVVKLLPNNETELLYETKNQYYIPHINPDSPIVNDSEMERDFLKSGSKNASIQNSKRFNALTAKYFDSIINVTDILDDVENNTLSALRINRSVNKTEQANKLKVTKTSNEPKSAYNQLRNNQQAVDENNLKSRPKPTNTHGKIIWNGYPIIGPKYTYPRPSESRF